MQESNKNIIIVSKMIKYCDKILDIKKDKSLTKEKYMADDIIQLAIDMCIYQLTELSKYIDDSFKLKHLEIEWAKLRGMRNIHAHDYEKIDRNIIWDTIEYDIEKLKQKLCKII